MSELVAVVVDDVVVEVPLIVVLVVLAVLDVAVVLFELVFGGAGGGVYCCEYVDSDW